MIAALRAAPPKSGKPYLGRRALVIEGDAKSRALCVERLERLGFEVVEAVGGVDALRAARLETPDVILLDTELHDVPGVELIRWLCADPALARVPIAVVVASARRRSAPSAIAAGVRAVLEKPFTAADIDDAIAEALPLPDPASP